jgi:hypothetical protein
VLRRKQYCLLASPDDASTRPVIDEDAHQLPANRQGGIAHPIAEYDPSDDAGFLPNGLRVPRDPTARPQEESAAVWTVLVDCDIPEGEECRCPPIDYGGWHLYGPLGMANISDFEHYHYNPEADEMSMPLQA